MATGNHVRQMAWIPRNRQIRIETGTRIRQSSSSTCDCVLTSSPAFIQLKTMTVYKVLRRNELIGFLASARTRGSTADERDGFIHLSTASQLSGTLDKHFGGEKELSVLSFESRELGCNLRWEHSRNGRLFPHYYGELEAELIQSWFPVKRVSGRHVLPAGLN